MSTVPLDACGAQKVLFQVRVALENLSFHGKFMAHLNLEFCSCQRNKETINSTLGCVVEFRTNIILLKVNSPHYTYQSVCS